MNKQKIIMPERWVLIRNRKTKKLDYKPLIKRKYKNDK